MKIYFRHVLVNHSFRPSNQCGVLEILWITRKLSYVVDRCRVKMGLKKNNLRDWHTFFNDLFYKEITLANLSPNWLSSFREDENRPTWLNNECQVMTAHIIKIVFFNIKKKIVIYIVYKSAPIHWNVSRALIAFICLVLKVQHQTLHNYKLKSITDQWK